METYMTYIGHYEIKLPIYEKIIESTFIFNEKVIKRFSFIACNSMIASNKKDKSTIT